jgi:hypothetical protein
MSTVTTDDLKIARLRNRLRQLSDNELLRFGLIAKYACQADELQGERESSLRELQEAREEWNRRKPRLPLRGSF